MMVLQKVFGDENKLRNGSRNIGSFTADFRDGNVTVGNKTFPAGFFFMNALNEYWRDAPDGVDSDPNSDWLIANRLIMTHLPMWNIMDDITIGYIDETEAAKLHDNIIYILNVIRKAQPFRYLDLAAENEHCDSLFGEVSINRINQFLKEKARLTLNSEDHWLSHKHPNTVEIKRLAIEESHYDEYRNTLTFYNHLGNDMAAVRDFGREFVMRLETIEKKDESHLAALAMECMGQTPFGRWSKEFQNILSPAVEYLAIPKLPKRKTYTVGKRMTFTRFLDFLIADFFEGLHFGHYPKRCAICKRYFLRTDARNQMYCEDIDPNDPKKRLCRKVAMDKGRKAREKGKDHPLKRKLATRLNTIRVHVAKGKITIEEAGRAKKVAQNLCKRALRDNDYAKNSYIEDISQDAVYSAAKVLLK